MPARARLDRRNEPTRGNSLPLRRAFEDGVYRRLLVFRNRHRASASPQRESFSPVRRGEMAMAGEGEDGQPDAFFDAPTLRKPDGNSLYREWAICGPEDTHDGRRFRQPVKFSL